MKIIAIFRSRSQTIDFVSRLQRSGVTVQTVNTPKEARVGCGLSASFGANAIAQAKFILRSGKYTSFVGMYKWENGYGCAALTPV